MIDFNTGIMQLFKANLSEVESEFVSILIRNEKGLLAFKSLRDCILFTNKRIIILNIQGISGKKKDYTSIPYSKINTFSVQSSSLNESSTELELYVSGAGKIKIAFAQVVDIIPVGQIISVFALGDSEEQKELMNSIINNDTKHDITVGPDEWKCTNCGRINKNYVGTCGCGSHK